MEEDKKVKILYKNWKGNVAYREIIPIKVEFKSTEWHKEEQWILEAFDIQKNDMRGFAMKDIMEWN
ncbi:MAG: hypothetical protein Q4D02_00185 [Clostridia bacterium]|nr:hypothetical protein [Clostridia bacterium]